MIGVNQQVTVKTADGPRRQGIVLAAEVFNEGTMYLVALETYPQGVWFFNERQCSEGTFVEPLANEK